MKSLSLFISGFLTYTGAAQAVQETAQIANEAKATELPQVLLAEESRPLVKKFAGNIYDDEYWSDSVYYDYLNAFWQGYNMQSYNYAT